MTLQNHGTYKDKLQIYVPPGKKEIINKASDILKKEGSSLSKFIVEKLEEYYQVHEPGNPQQRLDTIMDLGKAYNCQIIRLCQHPVFLKQRVECAFEACPLTARRNLLFSSDKEMYTCQWRN